MRTARWIGPAITLVGAAVVLMAYLRGADRTPIEAGLLLPILNRYDVGLALVGLGLGLVQHRPWQRILGLVLFAIGLIAGAVLEQQVIAVALRHSYRFFSVFGPLCCVVVGLALVLPQRLRGFFLPGAALIAGTAFGVVVGLDDVEAKGVYRFEMAAGLAAIWTAAAVVFNAPWLDVPWIGVAGRIAGSWLIAIGLMVGAAGLMKPRAAVQAPPMTPPSPTVGPDRPKFPGAEEPDGPRFGADRSPWGNPIPP